MYLSRGKLSRAVEGSGSAGLARCRNGHRTFEWEWWVWMMNDDHAAFAFARTLDLEGLEVHVW